MIVHPRYNYRKQPASGRMSTTTPATWGNPPRPRDPLDLTEQTQGRTEDRALSFRQSDDAIEFTAPRALDYESWASTLCDRRS